MGSEHQPQAPQNAESEPKVEEANPQDSQGHPGSHERDPHGGTDESERELRAPVEKPAAHDCLAIPTTGVDSHGVAAAID